MGVWPRKKQQSLTPRIRNFRDIDEQKLLAFPAYKAGMTHTIIKGYREDSPTHGKDTSVPVTILATPPIKIASVRLYKKDGRQLHVKKQVNLDVDKEVERKIPKIDGRKTKDELTVEDDYDDISIQVYTQPHLIGLKKTPELFELKVGGNTFEDKVEFVKENLNKPFNVEDVFEPGQLVDVHGITKGKGTQGPVKRFGIGLRQHKSQKGQRKPGSLGPWKGQHHWMYRVPRSGQTGMHKRTQHNNLLMKIGKDPEDVNPDGGFVNFGEVKGTYTMVKGSVPGPKKRMVVMTETIRPKEKTDFTEDHIQHINTESKQ